MSGEGKTILYAGGFGVSWSAPRMVGGMWLNRVRKLRDWCGVWGKMMLGGARVLGFLFDFE